MNELITYGLGILTGWCILDTINIYKTSKRIKNKKNGLTIYEGLTMTKFKNTNVEEIFKRIEKNFNINLFDKWYEELKEVSEESKKELVSSREFICNQPDCPIVKFKEKMSEDKSKIILKLQEQITKLKEENIDLKEKLSKCMEECSNRLTTILHLEESVIPKLREEHQAKIKELEVETAKGIEEGLKFYKPKTIELQQEICKLKEEIRWLKVAKLNKAIKKKNK